MKFISFNADDRELYGIAIEDGIISMTDEFPEWPTLRSVIAAGGLEILQEKSQDLHISHEYGNITYRIPVPDPEKIICVGINYPARNEEYSDRNSGKGYPSLFVRFARSFSGHLENLHLPGESRLFDYEGEIVLIIGKGGRRIPARGALEHVAGISLCNEGTLRDWVRHARFNVTQGKNFDRSGSMGPWMVHCTRHDQLRDIELSTRVNGEVRQQDRTSRMIFPPERLIEYISSFTTLIPGDVIVTGTPTGAGARLDPPLYLEDGDVVEVEAEGIGILRNTVSGPT